MSLFSQVCDAWAEDLLDHVAGLEGVKLHLYAPWSLENLIAAANERHMAIWPDTDAETTEPLVTDGSKLATETYSIVVWEDASAEGARKFDNDRANLAWLELAETIRGRLMRQGGIQLGNSQIMSTDYAGLAFPSAGGLRVMAFAVTVRVPLARTA